MRRCKIFTPMLNKLNLNKDTVLGIDPGYERLGISILQKNKKEKRESVLYSDCFKTSAKIPFEERLLMLGKEIERVISEYKPATLSIENLFLSNNQKTAMRVSEVRGVILYQAISNGLAIKEFTPLQIKTAVGGNGRSDKTAVIKMIHHLVNISKKISHDDEYDAIAAALTYFAYHK
jgi:crossover junction endodeoxyribonuclease RuvC